MTVTYRTNPAVTYVPISPDEVIARGGHLEGFSLVISDETAAGLATGVLEAIGDGASAEDVHQRIGGDSTAQLEDVRVFLEELRQSGAALATTDDRATFADWNAFVRFGELANNVSTLPVTIAGGLAAEALAAAARQMGLSVDTVAMDGLIDLSPFVATEAPPDGDESRSGMTMERVLVVVSEGARLESLLLLNERAIAESVPILYCGVSGVELAIGPYVLPGATACYWETEHQRARAMFGYSEYSVLMRARGPHASTPHISVQVLAAASLSHVIELALLGHSSLAGSVLRMRATSGEMRRSRIMRLPRCPVCLSTRPLLRNPLY